ncbi:MAG: sugar O-acetyltransferase [Micrococcaceae bacterium]
MKKDYFAGDTRTNRERMLAGDLYIADYPDSERIMKQAGKLADEYQKVFAEDWDKAKPILTELLGSVGSDVFVRPPLFVDYGENIHIGDSVFINYNLVALDVVNITIGDDCQIGPNVQLLTPMHPLDPQMRKDKVEAAQPIVLEDNVWLGGGVVVCPGVIIGENSVIGAGSVVTKDVPANSVAVGNPAKVIKQIS